MAHNPFAVSREAAQSKLGGGFRGGDMILKPGLEGVEIWQPDLAQSPPLAARPFPCRDETGALSPGFDDKDPTPWVVEFPILHGFGRGVLSVIIDDRRRDDGQMKSESPAHIFYDGFRNAVAQLDKGYHIDNSAGWPHVFKNLGSLKPGRALFFQGAVFAHGKGPYVRAKNKSEKGYNPTVAYGAQPRGSLNDDPVCIIMCANSAKDAFWKRLFAAWDEDASFDPTSLTHGKFVQVFSRGDELNELWTKRRMQAAPQASSVQRPQVTFGGQRQKDPRAEDTSDNAPKPYTVAFTDLLDPTDAGSCPASCLAGADAFIASRVKSWHDLLSFPTDEEIAQAMCRMAGPTPFPYEGRQPLVPLAVFDYVWRDYPSSWIPDDVRRAAAQMVSAQVPAGVPAAPAAAYQPPAAAGFSIPPRAAPPVAATTNATPTHTAPMYATGPMPTNAVPAAPVITAPRIPVVPMPPLPPRAVPTPVAAQSPLFGGPVAPATVPFTVPTAPQQLPAHPPVQTQPAAGVDAQPLPSTEEQAVHVFGNAPEPAAPVQPSPVIPPDIAGASALHKKAIADAIAQQQAHDSVLQGRSA